jgi:hypothetical protein
MYGGAKIAFLPRKYNIKERVSHFLLKFPRHDFRHVQVTRFRFWLVSMTNDFTTCEEERSNSFCDLG